MTDHFTDSWQIEHQCPQCGAPVILYETDRLLQCPFCRTKLYLVANGHFHYRIQGKDATFREIIHIPYWRIRGLSFSVGKGDVSCRFFDTSILAVDMKGIPASLGLRPQSLKLRFAVPGPGYCYLEPSSNVRTLMQNRCHNMTSRGRQVFIGETISLIYAPMFIENSALYDAVLERRVCPVPPLGIDALSLNNASRNRQIRFISTLCPQCGWDLQGTREALVLICVNCNSVWVCKNGAFEKLSFSVVEGHEGAEYYLPFWRMKPKVEGMILKTYADLIRLGNLPKTVTHALETIPLYFWAPAFKVNPALFLRWSRQLTAYQPLGKSKEILPRAACHPVTLPSGEAHEGIVVTLAGLVADKRKLLTSFDDIHITEGETLLEYHPFSICRNELIHANLKLGIDKNALAFGTEL